MRRRFVGGPFLLTRTLLVRALIRLLLSLTRTSLFGAAVLLRLLGAWGRLWLLRMLRFLSLLGLFEALLLLLLLLLSRLLCAFHALLLGLLRLLGFLAAFCALGFLRLLRLPLGAVGRLDMRSGRPLGVVLVALRLLLLGLLRLSVEVRFPFFGALAGLFALQIILLRALDVAFPTLACSLRATRCGLLRSLLPIGGLVFLRRGLARIVCVRRRLLGAIAILGTTRVTGSSGIVPVTGVTLSFGFAVFLRLKRRRRHILRVFFFHRLFDLLPVVDSLPALFDFRFVDFRFHLPGRDFLRRPLHCRRGHHKRVAVNPV